MLVAQGYLDSADGGVIGITADSGGRYTAPYLSLNGILPHDAKTKIRHLARLFVRHSRCVGAVPLSLMMKIGMPGEGSHIGGSLPMRKYPRAFETDNLGRLAAWPNVHIVDASVLPRLPAASYTYTIMVNAHRIASAAARLA
jgi:choline dehydrogenase-like flavoprotein